LDNAKKVYVVVVGVGMSEAAEAAIEQALELASAHERSEVHAISATEDFEFGMRNAERESDGAVVVATRARLASRLHQKLDDMHRSGRVDCRSGPPRIFAHVRRDGPAREIARLATVVEADLIVVGAQRRSGHSLHAWGTVAETLCQALPCRVLVVDAFSVQAVA
jgi:nucleotide-binding universal stress UspA family protein